MPVITQQVWKAIQSGIAPPPISGLVSGYGLFNLNNGGYPEGTLAGGGDVFAAPSLSSAPYALDWPTLIANSEAPPYLLENLYDQTTYNNLSQTGPVAQILSNTIDVPTTITVGGTVRATVSASGFNGDVPLLVDFTVPMGTNGAHVANDYARPALTGDATFDTFFAADADGNSLIATFLTPGPNDPTASLTIEPLTAVGLVTSNSTITTPGQGDRRPTLVNTTSMFYLGQEYTWRGIDSTTGSDPQAYYVLDGQDDHGASGAFTIGLDNDGVNIWRVYGPDAGTPLTSSTDFAPFPNLATWPDAPVTASPTGSGFISNTATTGLAGELPLFAGGVQKGLIGATIYISDLAGAGVIAETGAGTAGLANRISFRMALDKLIFSVYDATAVAALPNSKMVTIPAPGWYRISGKFDTTQGTAANQTSLKLDDSAVGVTSPASANLGSAAVGGDVANLLARDVAGTLSSGFPGYLLDFEAFSGDKDAAFETSWNTWSQAIRTYSGGIYV